LSAKTKILPDIGQDSCGKRQSAAKLRVIMNNESSPQDLVRHIAASTGLPEATAGRVVADITAYFAETVEDFVCRRHDELKRKQRKNDEIWPLIAAELKTRRFSAEELSWRQLRRIAYDRNPSRASITATRPGPAPYPAESAASAESEN
jgi:hypothetical protein